MDTTNDVNEIRKHTRIYIAVFVGLAVLTVVTVSVSYVHLVLPLAVAVALIIATIKGSMVASFFMHLIQEKKLVYAALILTFLFLLALMFLPLLGHVDRVRY